jgi:CheY-like chemotaxis protein
VRDTGIGIAPELLPRIFDLFTQAERSLDRSLGGLGVGLALVQRLVELHRGQVEAVSALGKGSEFIVRLPLIDDGESRRSREPGETSRRSREPGESSQPVSPSLKVLVVDDNADAVESLVLLLRASGHHDVRTAYTGPDAVTTAIDYEPDVVLLDLGLPGLDGFEVAKRIRQHHAHRKTVLVAITGYGQESDRKRSVEAGFDHHLVKPAAFAQLKEILTAVKPR